MKLDYRKDIDGMRAIAVLAVVLNHAKIPGFSGGYIGVDVFFVISGFLITAIIAREIDEHGFTFVKFYERRIRRILPALVGVVIFVLLASFVLFDAPKIQMVGKSLIATTLFYSNINFWLEAGYFDAPSQLKPLLHTWSLAVEEQFYIVFPLLMLILSKYVRRFRNPILSFILAISLGFAIYQAQQDQAATFYLAHFRMWELLTGTLLALGVFQPIPNKTTNIALGIAGMILIVTPVFLYTENTPFPGLAAIPSVAGTALVIYSNSTRENFTGRILGNPALVFIGKISYSLYLWHWPLIIFAKYYLIRPMTSLETGIVLILTLVISTLSWRFIETPFRSKNAFSAKKIYQLAAAAMSVLLFVSGTVYYLDGFLTKAGLESPINVDRLEFEECDINYIDNPEDILTCRIGEKSQPVSFMIWGDSHAPTFGKAANDAARNSQVAGVLTYAIGCPSLMEIDTTPKVGDLPCTQYNEMVIKHLEAHSEITTVILTSRMMLWVEGSPYKQEEGPKYTLKDNLNEAPVNADSGEIFKLGISRTIQALQGIDKQVVVIVPIPEIGYDVPSANFIASRTRRDANEIVAPSVDEYLSRTRRTRDILNELKDAYGIQLIEPSRILCDQSICRAVIDHIPLYSDNNHLSGFGSEFITSIFDPLFVQLAQQ
ncbi:MAG: acyltransferase [Chloroflexi bacterium]|nr:acyltransferase [Chloroflexota bacterium]